MITAIHTSLAKKRSALENDDKGFTLIELLVVVLIIGILAAIAIPVFLGQQNQAKDAAAKSDVGNAKVAIVSYATANGGKYLNGTAQLTEADLKDYGFAKTTGTTLFTVFADNTGKFCISEKSEAGNIYKILDSGSISGGASTTSCAAVTG